LWAVMPFLAIGLFMKIAFGTSAFFRFLGDRLIGWFHKAFLAPVKGAPHVDPLASLTPGNLLTAPELWLGLIFAAICLAATVRMRRYREPI